MKTSFSGEDKKFLPKNEFEHVVILKLQRHAYNKGVYEDRPTYSNRKLTFNVSLSVVSR